MNNLRTGILLLALAVTQHAMAAEALSIQDLQTLPGERLVKLLLDEKTRTEAYYELCRRHNPKKWKDSKEFYRYEFNQIAEVIVCPQRNGKQPLYAVLNRWDTIANSQGCQTSGATKLPPLPKNYLKKRQGPLVFFTAKGEQVSPYNYDPDMFNGFLGDLNNDGLVERVQRLHFNPFNWEFDIAEVSVISEKPTLAVAVVYNWYPLSPAAPFTVGEWSKQLQKEKWRIGVADRNGDGFYEVEFGPARANGVEPKLTLRWDKASALYVCSKGKKGKHFQVIYADALGKSRGRLWIEGQEYNLPLLTVVREQKQIGSKDYRYISLKNLTNEQIVNCMGPSKEPPSAFEERVEVPSRLPKDFWNTPAKKAARVLAEVNRTLEHRRMYRLSIEASQGQKPPDICSLSFQYMANHFQFSFDFFVRCDPKGSYLVFALQGNRHSGSLGPCSLCFLKLDYDDARNIAHIVWWLNRVKSLPTRDEYKHRFSRSWSSADGHAQLRLISDSGKVILDKWDNVWYGAEISERWNDGYDKEVLLNLAAYVIQKELVAYLNERYPAYESEVGYYDSSVKEVRDKSKLEKFKEHTRKAFRLFSLDERNVPLDTVLLLVKQVGEMGSAELKVDLQKLLKKLPPRDEEKLKELEKKRKKWEEELESFESEAEGYPDEASDPNNIEASIRKYENLTPTQQDKKLEQTEYLRAAILTALKKIDVGSDPNAMERMATDDLSWWAAERLKKKDIDRYLNVLEDWLTKAPEWEQESIFEEVAEIRPARARAIARRLRPENACPLATVALMYLEKQDGEVVRDEDPIVQAVIGTALDPNIGSGFRRMALESLVPYENPQRYKTPKIDEALLKLLDPKLADSDVLNFTLVEACKALARRDGAKYFDKIMGTLKANLDETLLFDDLVSAVALAVQTSDEKHRAQLSRFLRAQLRRTPFRINDLIWAAWAADLQDLKPELERIATSGPEVCEDENSSGSAREVRGRCHLARKVVSLWNEEDAVTRAKLLIAFGFEYSHDMDNATNPERLNCLRLQLSDVAKGLSNEGRMQVASFLEWRAKHKRGEEDSPYYQEERTRFAALLQPIISIGNREQVK